MRGARQFAGRSLQRLADFKQFLDVLLRELRGARAAIGQQYDKPFGREHLERLAQRGARYRERRAQLAFGNSRAGRNFALRQDVPEAGNHLVMHHIEVSSGTRWNHFECKNDQNQANSNRILLH